MAVNPSAFGPKPQFELSSGAPAVGNKLFFYVAGSVNTKQNTYTNSTGGSANTNPVILDALGMPTTTELWWTAGQSYKVVYAPSTDTDPPTSPIWTIDNLVGINDVTASFDEWKAGPTPTFVSATSFTLVGDQTSTFTKSRRVKTTNTAGTAYSSIVSSVFGALTTVTVANDAGGNTLDAGLSAVSYGLLSAVNPSITADEIHRKGTAVASAATTDIWSIAGDYVHVTGVTGITSFGTAPYAGAQRTLIFDGALIITNNGTSLQCPGAADISTAAGDRAVVVADTTANMIISDFVRADGQAVQPLPKSLAPNPFFAINQRTISGTSANDTYILDRWYVLNQTNPVTPSQQTLQENGQATNLRITQSNAAAQRIGVATILESKDSQPWRGRVMTFRPRVRISNSQAIRIAVLEWTGTADVVTSDVVLSWTSTTYTANNFFLAANLAVTGVGAKTPSANTWTDMDPLTVTIGSSCNNLILFAWVEATAAQNVTFDIGKVRFVPGTIASDIYIPTFEETLRYCQRYYEKTFDYATGPAQNTNARGGALTAIGITGSTGPLSSWRFKTAKFSASSSITTYSPQSADANWRDTTNARSVAVGVGPVGTDSVEISNGAAGTTGDIYEIHAQAVNEL